MKLLAIMIWACTSGPNSTCPAEPYEVPVLESMGPVTPYACMGPTTQKSLEQFQREHPGLKVRRWTCGESRRGQFARI